MQQLNSNNLIEETTSSIGMKFKIKKGG